MEKKAVRVAYGEALVKLGEANDKVVVLDADLASATMTNGFKKHSRTGFMTVVSQKQIWWIWLPESARWA